MRSVCDAAAPDFFLIIQGKTRTNSRSLALVARADKRYGCRTRKCWRCLARYTHRVAISQQPIDCARRKGRHFQVERRGSVKTRTLVSAHTSAFASCGQAVAYALASCGTYVDTVTC